MTTPTPISILVVEARADNAGAIEQKLLQFKSKQLHVAGASALPAAFARLSAKDIDLIILDLSLFTEDGIEGFEHIRNYAPHLPIIVVADAMQEALALRLVRMGAQDYILSGQINAAHVLHQIRCAIERTRSLEIACEREERYRTLFDVFPEMIYVTSPRGVLVDVNPAAETLLGYAREELFRMNVQSLLAHPAKRQQLLAQIEEKGAVRDYEVQLTKKDGTQIDCLLTAAPRHASDGSFLGYHGSIRDITHRRSLEEMWRRYEFIVNTSKEFMTLISRDYVYEATNESYCHAHNKTREEVVGKTVAQLWGEGRYLDKIKETLDKCLAGNETHFQGWLGFSALGRRYMDVTYYPYYNAQGEVTHAVVVSRDITERKQAELALQHIHAQNQQLLVSIPSILIGVSSNDDITHWNAPAEAAFGIPTKDVIGKPFLECDIQWDWLEILKRVGNCRRETKSISLSDVKYTRPDGKEGFLNIIVSPFAGEADEQPGFLLVGEDVTERKVLESQLSHAQKLESIGQLAAGIAHEINTPTQYVGDNIRFFQDSFTDISDVLAKYETLLEAAKTQNTFPNLVADIEAEIENADIDFLIDEVPTAIAQSLEGIDHVSGIVRAMKEFSHPGVEEKTAIDINRAIESTITVARNEWKYVATVATDFDYNLPPVPCLPGEFNQAILNMIINAAHAIADVVDEKNEARGTITISTRRDGDWAEIRVQDTGTGIPPEIRSKIFDPFFTTKEVGRGTGQGLSISHSVIVEKHNGTITFETEVDKGTTFIIHLPLDVVGANGDR